MEETEKSIFPQYGFWPVTMEAAATAARRAGYRPTEHGTYQRGAWRAVRFKPMPDGVVVERAWTTGQIIALGVVLTLIAIFACGGA